MKSRGQSAQSGTGDAPSEQETVTPDMPSGAVQTSLVCAWNCRGLMQALPYIQELAEEHDVIILSGHWLWPYELHKLDEIHPDFASFGTSDQRLNAECTLTRRCGGVAVLWRKNLPLSPVHLDSDRIIAVQLPLKSHGMLTVTGVYHPSSDHPLETFREYLSDLEGMISSLQRNGPGPSLLQVISMLIWGGKVGHECVGIKMLKELYCKSSSIGQVSIQFL